MTYKATLKVSFDTEWTSTHYSSGFDDMMLPEEHYTFQIPAEDLNTYQLFNFFATVVTQTGVTTVNDTTAVTEFVLPAGAQILEFFVDITTAYAGTTGNTITIQTAAGSSLATVGGATTTISVRR